MSKNRIIGILLATFILMLFIMTPIIVFLKTLPYNNRDAWIGFWGGFSGSFLGVIATIIALGYTYFQNNAQHRATQDALGEQSRLQIMPAINTTCSGIDVQSLKKRLPTSMIDISQSGIDANKIARQAIYSEHLLIDILERNPNNYLLVELEYRNVGQGSLMNLVLVYKEKDLAYMLEGMINGEICNLVFLFDKNINKDTFEFYFYDVNGRGYMQTLKIEHNYADFKYEPTNTPIPCEHVSELVDSGVIVFSGGIKPSK